MSDLPTLGSSEPGIQRMGRLARLPAWLVLVGLTVLGLAATIAATFLAGTTTDKWSEDLLFEVAKAGVQIVAVGVLGGAIAAAWRTRESKKDERAKAREELLGLITLYHDVKRVRRVLKSHGLDLNGHHGLDLPVEPDQRLTEQQAQTFHEQMLTLTTLQLEFESKVRQFGQTNLLGRDTEQVVRLLGGIEQYLHEILKEAWERRGWTIHAGTSVAVVSGALQSLFRRDPFRTHLSVPLREITRLINAHVFSAATAETQNALARVEENDAAAEDADEPEEEGGAGGRELPGPESAR